MTPRDSLNPAPAPAAHCVDCGQEVADDHIFRVLRRDTVGRRHVVCQTCADRRHAEARPAPLQVRRTPPPRSVLGGARQPRGDESGGQDV